MRDALLIVLALASALAGAWAFGAFSTRAWRRRQQMQTDAQWWDSFQKRVRGL